MSCPYVHINIIIYIYVCDNEACDIIYIHSYLIINNKHHVEELKNIRKEYGAQSKEYKNALTTLEK